jgi:hypothetical protein
MGKTIHTSGAVASTPEPLREIRRLAAASLLADLFDDQGDVLVDLLLDADPPEWPMLRWFTMNFPAWRT